MAKIIKNKLGNFLVICLIFLTVTVWVFSGWPQIWKNPPVPPEIKIAQAASTIRYFHETAATADPDRQRASSAEPTTNGADNNNANVTGENIFSNGSTTNTWISDDLVGVVTIPSGNWTFKVECKSTRTANNFFPRVKVYKSSDTVNPIFTTTPGTNCNTADYTTNSWTHDPGEIALAEGERLVYELWQCSDGKGGGGKRDYVQWGNTGATNDNKTQVIDTYTPPTLSITAPENVQMPDYQLGGGGYSEVNFSDVVRVTADAGFTVTVSSADLTGGGNTILASDVKLRTDGNIENNPTRIPSASCSGFTPTEPAANEYALDTAKNVVTATLGAGGTCDIYPTIKVYISNNLSTGDVSGTLTFTVQ